MVEGGRASLIEAANAPPVAGQSRLPGPERIVERAFGLSLAVPGSVG